MYSRCPKCAHAPLPAEQALPAACPACGVILAKVGQAPRREAAAAVALDEDADSQDWTALLWRVPRRVDSTRFWLRCALWLAFAAWGLVLIAQDFRTGEIGHSFLHRPLLIFHEAGHLIFMPLGEWMTIAGGTLAQLIMPALMAGALLWKNRDPFGASFGLWLLGVSLLDVAPYMYDALQPQLMLLSGRTGEEGGHDWIYLFSSLGWLGQSQAIGAFTHKLGALVVLLSLAWSAFLLKRQHGRLAGDLVREEEEA